MSVYRYKRAINVDILKRGVDPSTWASLSAAAVNPAITVDITIDAGATNKEDLDAIMLELNWAFDSVIVP